MDLQQCFNIVLTFSPMFSASLKVSLSPRKKKDGYTAAILRVTIDRKHLYINLNCDAPKNEFDSARGEWVCKGANKAKANDFNLICRDSLGKANEILVQYRLKRLELTLEIFNKEYHTKNLRFDLLVYMKDKMRERLNRSEISLSTFKHHTGTLNHLMKCP
jgi:hypothetical protein